MTKFIILLLCFAVATSQRSGNSIIKGYSQNEIQRQNRITQRIIENFLERKLFPNRRPQHEVPTIDEILPVAVKDPPRTKLGIAGGGKKRYKPKTALELLRSGGSNGGGGQRSGFRPANPKYSGSRNKPNGSEADEDQQDTTQVDEDYYEDQPEEDDYSDDSDGGGVVDQEDGNYENYDELTEGDEGKGNTTAEILTGDRGLISGAGGIGALGDYDDIESLQSVESEHLDLFYRNHQNKRFNHRLYLDELDLDEDCPNCVDDTQVPNRWTMPVTKLGDKRYYLGVFFKANWYRAAQYCRFHGMHLASISSQEENDRLEKHVRDFGFGNEHFWTSGTDLADEGNFFWMATGRPITFTNWNAGEPNNFRYENGEEENCMELWNRDGKGLKWNDSPCSFETYFVCEVQ